MPDVLLGNLQSPPSTHAKLGTFVCSLDHSLHYRLYIIVLNQDSLDPSLATLEVLGPLGILSSVNLFSEESWPTLSSVEEVEQIQK